MKMRKRVDKFRWWEALYRCNLISMQWPQSFDRLEFTARGYWTNDIVGTSHGTVVGFDETALIDR